MTPGGRVKSPSHNECSGLYQGVKKKSTNMRILSPAFAGRTEIISRGCAQCGHHPQGAGTPHRKTGRPVHVIARSPGPSGARIGALRRRPETHHGRAEIHRGVGRHSPGPRSMPSTTCRSRPAEVPTRMHCVPSSGWSWEKARGPAPRSGRSGGTPGVRRAVQVCGRAVDEAVAAALAAALAAAFGAALAAALAAAFASAVTVPGLPLMRVCVRPGAFRWVTSAYVSRGTCRLLHPRPRLHPDLRPNLRLPLSPRLPQRLPLRLYVRCFLSISGAASLRATPMAQVAVLLSPSG